jgi:hypothetical protein
MPEASLDAALDELYAADPSDFVTTRKRLIADLRTAGAKDSAKELQGARRPGTAAWALNQLARRHPDVVEALLDRGSELQAAQMRAVSGKPDALRDSMRAHRKALDDATDAALAILGARANDSFRNEIVSTLHAASADAETGRLLRTGRMIHEAQFQGFPDAAGLTLVPELPESGKTAARKRPKAEREREARRRSNLAARDAARKQEAEAVADVRRARARIDELERELDVARRALDTASDRSRKAAAEAARFDALTNDDAPGS